MATNISYTPPAVQVQRQDVCYRAPNSPDVQQGFLEITYMGDEEISRRLESLGGATVIDYELAACPVVVQTTINNKQIIIFKNRITNILVYAINVINDNSTITTTYWNIDGSVYIGNIIDLEIYDIDKLNYTAPSVLCVDGTQTVTRTDVWDENRNLVTVIWQDLIGRIVPEPTGTIKAGSCDLVLDTEVIPQVDNLLDNGQITGRYVWFYRVNVHNNQGTVIYSNSNLVNGTTYVAVGKVTAEPIVPPVMGLMRRLEGNGQVWESNPNVQSISFAIEYANKANTIEVVTPDRVDPVVLNKLNYMVQWGVDGSHDPNLYGIRITSNASAKALVNWTEQLPSIDVTDSVGGVVVVVANAARNPLDERIPVPADLNDGIGPINFDNYGQNHDRPNKHDRPNGHHDQPREHDQPYPMPEQTQPVPSQPDNNGGGSFDGGSDSGASDGGGGDGGSGGGGDGGGGAY